MAVQHIFTYLVHPMKGAAEFPQINGTAVKLAGKMFDLLRNIYEKSEQECDVDITFSPTKDGKQQNDCRDLICTYLTETTLATGRKIAERLERHTDGRSGIGLLFLISGNEGKDQKIVISRFPTDNAIYVDEDPKKLTVQFLERVFMKNKFSYKAVAYRDTSHKSGFWNGRAIDKQLNNPAGEVSNYWILDFLSSQLTVTAAAGTRRLANALRNAAKNADLDTKQEIVAAATLASGLKDQHLNIEGFCERFGLSPKARSAITSELVSARVAQENFRFDLGEFQNLIAYKSVELNNGGTLSAPSSEFDNVFHQQDIDGVEGRVRFVTEGKIINEKLKPTA